ncbi:universal stress protein UspA [Aliiroseovarius zhejiangensis]|uniref:Universal stress protein UspA n=1 Tax=Aliiroseovarius zhejiangensis TaxID=1632025 RepID=A0ABQ3IYK7_9RHOB|nr:universal stress protein [Aliiroseovarius zhejiangensis]GHE98359.1 universal stress protein UspA [Aliiroseovarius zhejiangensis]
MSKTILCAVDINRPEEEREVLTVAAKLARIDGAQLDVITVVPDFGMSVVGAYFQDHQVEPVKERAKTLLKEMTKATLGAEQDAKVRHIVAVGTVYEEVLRISKLDKTDLIVIGAHRPDLKDYLLGPNAARVVRHSDCSVYVVRH